VESARGDHSKTADRVRSTVEEIGAGVREQIQSLRPDIQNYQALVVENGQARQSIDSLQCQLEAEKQRFQELDESASALRQTEVDLRSQLNQLGHELEASKSMPCRHDPHPVELEQKVVALQQQLEQANRKCESVNEKWEQSERLRGQQHELLATHKV
jgi:chromosome segregation ATPase